MIPRPLRVLCAVGLSIASASVAVGQCPPVFPSPILPLPHGVARATIADFDQNGLPDVATADGVASLASVSRNGTLFGFAAPDTAGTPAPAVHTAAGDVNGDGAPDLVTVQKSPPSLAIFWNAGDGTFPAAPSTVIALSAGASPVAAVVVDVNGDATNDLVARSDGASPPSLLVLIGQGGGAFASPLSYLGSGVAWSVGDLAAADLNGDGFVDAVSSSGTAYLGNAIGGFAVSLPYSGADGEQLFLGDGNEDGRLDAYTAAEFFGAFRFHRNTGAGFAAPVSTFLSPVQSGIAVGDFDADAHLDVVASGYTNIPHFANYGMLLVFEGDGTGAYAGPPVVVSFQDSLTAGFPPPPFARAAADLDLDGDADLIAGAGNAFWPLRSTQPGPFELPVPQPVAVAVSDITAGHFNADFEFDAAVVGNTSAVRLLFNDGAGTLLPPVTLTVGGILRQIESLDMDGDSVHDLIVGGFTGNGSSPSAVRILKGDGNGGFALLSTTLVLGAIQSLQLDDLDGNGMLDALVSEPAIASFTMLLGNGNGGFSNVVDMAIPGGSPFAFVMSDLDGNGTNDILFTNRDQANCQMLAGDGFGGFGSVIPVGPTQLFPEALLMVDIDGDFTGDAVIANRGSGSLTIFHNTGIGLDPPQHYSIGPGTAPSALMYADVQQDDSPEILVSLTNAGAIAVLETGTGTPSLRASIFAGKKPGALLEIALQDDANGIPDVLAGVTNDVVALRNRMENSYAQPYGNSKAGPNGTPFFDPAGLPSVGSEFSLAIRSGTPGIAPVLLVGTRAIEAPFDGGELLVDPVLILTLPPFDLAGSVTILEEIPALPVLCAVEVCLQSMFVHPNASGFYHTVQTEGLLVHFGH